MLVLCIGATAFAGPIAGSAEVCARFDKTDLIVFDTVVDLDCTISALALGMTAILNLDHFDNLFFTAEGTLGTIDFRSMVDFEPQTPALMAWTNAARINFGGATLFGVFAVKNLLSPESPEFGAGGTLGIYGTTGSVTLTAATYFNMLDTTGLYHYYGYDWMVAFDAFERCGEWYKAYIYPYGVMEDRCDLAWSGASIYADFPLACLCVTSYIHFSCLGLNWFGLEVSGTETGIPWLSIRALAIDFGIRDKRASIYWELICGDLARVTPYLSLGGDQWTSFWDIEGITLNALLLEFTYNGVTIKAGEIFDHTWYPYSLSSPAPWGFTLSGGLTFESLCFMSDECIYNEEYDEFFGIWIDGDSCCGGAYDVSVISFFDTTQTTALFDWAETVADFDFGVGSSTSVGFSLSLKADGLQWFQLCWTFRFGEGAKAPPEPRSRPAGTCGPSLPTQGSAVQRGSGKPPAEFMTAPGQFARNRLTRL